MSKLRYALVIMGSGLLIAIGIYAFILYQEAFGSGWGMQNTAYIVVHDEKKGMRAIGKAISYGDAILPLLAEESDGFRKLNSRNSIWIVEVLGAIRTQQSDEILMDLYARAEYEEYARIVGVIGLVRHGNLPGDWSRNELLIECIRGGDHGEYAYFSELAIRALGESRNPKAIPLLRDILKDDNYSAALRAQASHSLLALQAAGINVDAVKDPSQNYAPPK